MARYIGASLLLALATGAAGFSGGSPICHTDQIIGCLMGFPVPEGAGIFSIQLDRSGYTPGQKLTLTIYPSDSFTRLNGLLLYVESPEQIGGDGYPIKVGHFDPNFPFGLRFGCSSESTDNVVTHQGGIDQILPLQFTWTPPDDAPRLLRIRAIVLRAGNAFEWDNAPYEMFSIELPLDPVFSDSFE